MISANAAPSAALSGRVSLDADPGLKPWAMICSRFAAKSFISDCFEVFQHSAKP